MPSPKLSHKEAKELRILRAVTGLPFRELGALYDVAQSSVGDIIHGFSYPDAGGPVEKLTPGPKREPAVHGSASKYARGCRCELCTAANKVKCLNYRRRKHDPGAASPGKAVRRVHRDQDGDNVIPAG